MVYGSTVTPGRVSRFTEASADFTLGMSVMELVSIREQLLDAGPVSFAIPGNAQHDAGFGPFRVPAFHWNLRK